MKTVVTLAIGFFIARQYYINMDKDEAREKEANAKKKLNDFLSENGLTEEEIREQSKEILGK